MVLAHIFVTSYSHLVCPVWYSYHTTSATIAHARERQTCTIISWRVKQLTKNK